MAARALASLTVTFGMVSIPVKLYTATQAQAAVSFNLLHGGGCGSRLKQQYVCAREGTVVERTDMVKGYEFAKDQYVTFTPEESIRSTTTRRTSSDPTRAERSPTPCSPRACVRLMRPP